MIHLIYKSILFILILSLNSLPSAKAEFDFSQTDFRALFNQYRIGVPDKVPWAGSYYAYSENGTAVLVGSRSPMQAYDLLAGTDDNAQNWELNNHTCKIFSGREKESCRQWYGHCNAWAAAAVKEVEPREPLGARGITLTVAEQKGILTEIWMNSGAIMSGTTDKTRPTGTWIKDTQDPSFKAFWDITPRAFFMLLTNYVGGLKTSIVIDRYTGHQVWNAPLLGYRILPIHSDDITEINDGGYKYYAVKLTTKIYWVNSSYEPGHITNDFNLYSETNDSAKIEPQLNEFRHDEFAGRVLTFKLFFDAPVTVSNDGLQVLTAGRITGDGIWSEMENLSAYFDFDKIDRSHPDFIWLPTDLFYNPHSSYGNPFVDYRKYNSFRDEAEHHWRSLLAENSEVTKPVTLELSNLHIDSTDEELWRRELTKAFLREELPFSIEEPIRVENEHIFLPVTFPQGVDSNDLKDLLNTIGITVHSITN